MARIAPFILLILLAVGMYGYFNTRQEAPEPYAACAKMTTDAERAKCHQQVDFAMSAGW